MNPADALPILHALANGTDPVTGEVYAPDSPYQRAETVRALYAAIHALERLPTEPLPADNSLPSSSPAPAVADETLPLTADQQTVFDRLRKWRGETATAAGLAAYVIAHNRMLEDMVRLPARTEADLLNIKGFGALRMEKYGQEILALLNADPPTPAVEKVSTAPVAPVVPPPSAFVEAKPEAKPQMEPVPTEHTREAARKRYPLPRFHPLLLTEVTRMQGNHFCIAAYDLRDGILVRPLRPHHENWIFDEFQEPYQPGQLVHAILRETHQGLFPHRMEDRLVSGGMQVLEEWTEAELHSALLPTCAKSLVGIFGSRPQDNRYFPEGTRCPSLGGLAIPRRRIRFHQQTKPKLRLHLEDADGVCCSLPVTCHKLRGLFDPETDPQAIDDANTWLNSVSMNDMIVLRVGLCRGYAGTDNEFQPKRCFLQINGVVRPNETMPTQ